MSKVLLRFLLIFCLFTTATAFKAHASILVTCDTLSADTVPPVYKAQDGKVYPPVPDNPNRLFYLQRSKNINAVCYDVNINPETGLADEKSPVNIYWLRFAEANGEKEDLTYIQRKFAYGITSKPLGNGNFDIRLVSYDKIPFKLMQGTDGKYHIFAFISKKRILLKSIFIKTDGGSMWSPNVIFVEMKGTDPETGKEVTERFKP